MQQVSITTEGIQKNLKSFKPLDALCEYIWNGFDAKAKVVEVKLHVNQLEMIDMISIIDDGTGIAYEELSDKFKPFNDSKKYDLSKKVNHSLPHGRQGIGRLTFFAFAQLARWSTVYEKDGIHYEYFIEMNKDELNQYNDNNENPPSETDKNCGTQVIFTQIQSFAKEDIIERIRSEFFWFLELNRDNGYKITVDGMPILYEGYVISRKMLEQPEEVINDFEITFVQWNHSLGKEFSKFYYIDSDGVERYKEATKLNKKSDEFYHSIYIKSSYFNDFFFEVNDEVYEDIKLTFSHAGRIKTVRLNDIDRFSMVEDVPDYIYNGNNIDREKLRKYMEKTAQEYASKMIFVHK